MKFLLGQRLFNNNIFCATCIIPYPRNNHATEMKLKLNKIKDKFNGIQVTNRSTEPLKLPNLRTASINQSSKQDDQSFISILDCPLPVARVTNTINDQFDRNAILTVYM